MQDVLHEALTNFTQVEWIASFFSSMTLVVLPSPLTCIQSNTANIYNVYKYVQYGQPQWLSGLVLPSAQGLILKTRDRVPRQAPCVEPVSPSACVSASLFLCLYE